MTHIDAALDALEQFLQDALAPPSATGPVATLLAQPPEILMQRVGTWVVRESEQRSEPICDLLLLALRKIFMMGELELLDREAVANFLDRATGLAVRMCPTEDRDLLRKKLAVMRMSRGTRSGNVPVPMPLEGKRSTVDEEAQSAKRFSLIYDRLTRQMESNPQGGAPDAQALAQLMTMAAARSQTGAQLNDYLEQLRPLTGKEGNVFVILGGGLPSWDIPNMSPELRKAPSQVGAMEKIIDLAEDPTVTMKRFRELVTAAVGKFNEGSLAAAVWMLDVGEDTITEKKLDMAIVDKIRAEAVETISSVQLRKYAESKTKHAALRIALSFFPNAWLDALFRQLRGEQKADRRRTLLGFIEAYGIPGRDAALDELRRELGRSDLDTYYLRNLIYILHRIQRETDEGVDKELEVLSLSSAKGQNVYVVKEAATAIGQIRSDAAAQLLTLRLAECESNLLRPEAASIYPAGEGQKLLDRIIAALARIGSSAALLTIARHGMQANPALGDTRARLSSLGQHDLSFDDATVKVLLGALRSDIPGKLLGRLLPKRQESTVRLIEALSGTRTEETEAVFRDIAQRFPEQEVGKAAALTLEKWFPTRRAAEESSAATLAGELEFFGLPSVMQSLAEMRATGLLTLSTKQGKASAKLAMLEGKFLNAQTGQVRGPDAVYEMLERPIAGTFAFVPRSVESMRGGGTPQDVMGLLLEGVRRNDELQRITALVPDQMLLDKTNVKPTPHEEEEDASLVRDVWLKASAGVPVVEWEREIPTDVFRIRRLVAHWLEQGALVAR